MNIGKRCIKEWIIRSVILMVGLTIAHLGVTLFLLSDLGQIPSMYWCSESWKCFE